MGKYIAEVINRSSAGQSSGLASRIRIQNPIWGLIWYFLGLPVILLVSSFFSWGEIILPLRSIPMILMVSVLYIGIWANRHQSDNYRSYRAFGLSAFYTTIGFLLIFSALAIVRTYYSRSFLLTSYILTLIWLACGMLFFRNSNYRQFLIIEGGVADKLKKLSKFDWQFVKNLTQGFDLIQYDGIVVDLHAHNNPGLLKTLANSSLQGIPVLHAAAVLEQHSGRTNLEYLAHEGLYKLGERHTYSYLKRIWEILLIILLSPVIIPVMILTAVAIKLESDDPVFFKQQRVGKDGKLFTLYKFRSMKENADTEGAQFAQKEDDRITNTGKFIRRFRIDELPQFWNVLKGDMSLIGPRPEQQEFVESFEEEIPFYSYRNKVRPGITGWAQIKNGYASDLDSNQNKLEYDLYYVKNLSLSLDLLIVYATLKTVITGFGSR